MSYISSKDWLHISTCSLACRSKGHWRHWHSLGPLVGEIAGIAYTRLSRTGRVESTIGAGAGAGPGPPAVWTFEIAPRKTM